MSESPRLALVRELREELGLTVEETTLDPVGFAEEAPADGHPGIVLLLYRCRSWVGTPQSLDGQIWRWLSSADATSLAMPEMDRALLSRLP